jgi:hypothetical protein
MRSGFYYPTLLLLAIASALCHAQGKSIHANAISAISDDELLYRKALAIHLDQGLKTPPEASVSRRILIEQMKLLLSRPEHNEKISESEIRTYYRSHRDRFRVPSRVSFRHVFFAFPRAQAYHRANSLFLVLQSKKLSWKSIEKRSDPFPLGLEFPFASEDFLSRRFGVRFALRLRKLKLNHWSRPIESPLGLHLIRIEKRVHSTVTPIALVRPTIVAAISKERAARRLERAMKLLR